LGVICENIGANIVIGTESWFTGYHQSNEFFPDRYNVFRRDRHKGKGGGVFIFVDKMLQCLVPEEINTGDCEMLWVQISVTGVNNLYVGAFYRPPNMDQPEYLSHLDTSLSRIPDGARIWMGGEFNLGDIDWENNIVIPSATRCSLCQQ
jgi:hypothetical protein